MNSRSEPQCCFAFFFLICGVADSCCCGVVWWISGLVHPRLVESVVKKWCWNTAILCVGIWWYMYHINIYIYIICYTCLFKRCLISAFCSINRFCIRTTSLGRPEFLLIYWCQTRFSAAKMPDQTAKVPDHVLWQFLTMAFFFRSGIFRQER